MLLPQLIKFFCTPTQSEEEEEGREAPDLTGSISGGWLSGLSPVWILSCLEFPWRIGFSGFVSFIGPLSTISKLTLLSSDCPVDRSFHFNFLTSRPIPLCAILQCQLSISCPQVGYWCTPRIRNVGLLLSLLLPIVLEHVVGHWVPETLCRCFGRHPFAPASSQFLNMASKTVETRIEWRRRRLRCPSYIKSVCLFMLGVIHTDYWHPF